MFLEKTPSLASIPPYKTGTRAMVATQASLKKITTGIVSASVGMTKVAVFVNVGALGGVDVKFAG